MITQYGNDCYEINYNGSLAGMITVTPYDDIKSAEINITIFDKYRGHHLAETAIKHVLKETKYLIIIGFVYSNSPCKLAMEHIFSKLGFSSNCEAVGDRMVYRS